MKLAAVLAVLVAVASLLHAQRSGHATDTDSLRISQLTELELTLNDLIAKRDFDTYAQYLADDDVRISADGWIRTKDQVLEEFRASAIADGKAVPEVLQVRLYGNTAILTVRPTTTGERSTEGRCSPRHSSGVMRVGVRSQFKELRRRHALGECARSTSGGLRLETISVGT